MDRKYAIDNESDGLSLVDFSKYITKNIWIIIISLVFFIGLGIVYTWVIVTPVYKSQANIFYTPQESGDYVNDYARGYAVLRGLLPQQQHLIGSEKFLESVIERSKDPSLNPDEIIITDAAEKIADKINVKIDTVQLVMYIEVTHTDPEQAYIITKMVSEHTVDVFDEDQKESVTALQAIITNIAKIAESPIKPNKLLNVVISFIIGMLFALFAILIKEQFNTKFKSNDEIEKHVQLPILGEIYKIKNMDSGGNL